jgi:hypothetical protein
MTKRPPSALVDLQCAEEVIKKNRLQYAVGDHIYFEHQNQQTDLPYVIMSIAGQVLSHESDADLIKHMHKVSYAFEDCQTWVFANTDSKFRNPKIIPPNYSFKAGEGELMQVRGVATVSKHGTYRFYRFNPEDEWKAIIAKSKMKRESILVRANRISDTLVSNTSAEICLISDDLYYTEEGTKARLAWLAEQLQKRGLQDQITPRYIFQGDTLFDDPMTHLPVVPAAEKGSHDITVHIEEESPEAKITRRIREVISDEDPAIAKAALGSILMNAFIS